MISPAFYIRVRAVLLSFTVCAIGAQPFSVQKAGTEAPISSSGGAFQVTGTIAQVGEGSQNDDYVLTAGWTTSAAENATLPRLTVTFNARANQIVISWLPNVPGFVLQETTNPGLNGWTVTPIAGSNSAIISPGTRQSFFRLYKP